ncbi:MAG: hypothetical protein ABIS29_06550, partial [Vicinamibacterales bacterium]
MISRREFVSTSAAVWASGAVLAVTEGCTGTAASVVAPRPDMGSVRGTVVDEDGVATSVGRIFLLEKGGLSFGVYVDVDTRGAFTFGEIRVGEYQLQFWGANLAKVPEPLPNPVPISVRANATTVVKFQVVTAEESETQDRDINAGDFFFQEQPSGDPNGTVVVKIGTEV